MSIKKENFENNNILIGRYQLNGALGLFAYHQGICVKGSWFEIKGLGEISNEPNKILETNNKNRCSKEWCDKNNRKIWEKIESKGKTDIELNKVRRWNESWLKKYPKYSPHCVGGSNCQEYVRDLLKFLTGQVISHQARNSKLALVNVATLSLAYINFNDKNYKFQVGDKIKYKNKNAIINSIDGSGFKINFENDNNILLLENDNNISNHKKSYINIGKNIIESFCIILFGNYFMNEMS